MRQYQGISADNVWRMAATDLIDSPEHKGTHREEDTVELVQCALSISDPKQRWIPSRRPMYNPAFGLVEFIWIFNGENDSAILKFWNPQLPNFSGHSRLLHGAYGYRLRKGFGIDQIKRAYVALKSNPASRQVVLQIWNPCCDLPDEFGQPSSNDIPCNIMSLLKIRDGCLFWTQIMRSNDVMRGLPYDIIQFTLLQEFFASWLGCDMGDYVHISNSLHMYKNCIGKYGVDLETEVIDQSDENQQLNISFEETSHHLDAIYKDLVFISQLKNESGREKIRGHLSRIFSPKSNTNLHRPPLLCDILCVIGSDAARRLGDDEFAIFLLDRCNPTLRMVAMNWLNRNSKTRKENDQCD